MDVEAVRMSIQEISETLQNEQSAINDTFDKLLIAATNVFRLVDGQQRTLMALQGSPKELHGYVLNLIMHIRKMTFDSNERLLMDLGTLRESLKDD